MKGCNNNKKSNNISSLSSGRGVPSDDKLTTKSPVKLENTDNTYICSGQTENEATRYMESHISFIELE